MTQDIGIAYVENYDMTSGGMKTAGLDLWLNTLEPPIAICLEHVETHIHQSQQESEDHG